MIVQTSSIKDRELAYWMIISGDKILCSVSEHLIVHSHWQNMTFAHSYSEDIVQVGTYGDVPCYLIDTGSELLEHEQFEYKGLRSLLMQMGPQWFGILARAWQVALFLRTHRFCGQCGTRMHNVDWELAMQCHQCSHRCYPRISPCIIVAIRNEDRILLAKGSHHKDGMYSTLAGFVESGESLEEAVHREVFEEVGVQVKNLEYFSSQPWPFPHSLMMGYLADYAGGDIQVDDDEIIAADWFTQDNLPLIPPTFSIAGQLIQETFNRINN